ncbi:hypothetical protein BDZ45DRAFT_676206 [Acephala macrosclerotiorum]|nr:hypothetical protein BDZ45DRAFT_676206 [Acephala macrosclerotiorum]
MVTLKHEIPSDMEYEYADHTISERPGALLKAGTARDPSQNEPPLPPLGRDNGQLQKQKSQFQEFMDSMTPEARRKYVGQLDIFMQQILDQSREPGRAVGQDYELQLKLLELQSNKRILKQKIEQDEREGVTVSAFDRQQNQRLAGAPIGSRLPLLNAGPVAYPYAARLSTGLDKCNVYGEPTPSWSSNDVPRLQSFMEPNAAGAGNPSNAEQAYAQHHPFQSLCTYGASYHDFPPTKYHDTTTGEISYKTPGPRLLHPDADGNLVDTDGSLVYQANNVNEVSGPGCSASTSEHQGDSQSHSVSAYPTYQPHFPPSYQPTQHPFVSGPSRCLPDYQMQLMLLEQQNKKRLMMARQEQDAMLDAPAAIQECCQIGSSVLEQQNKERLMRQRQEQDSMMGIFRVNPQEAQQDYQLQLMQLEQQNKKRLMRARMTGQNPMTPFVKAEPCPSPELRSHLRGSPGMSCSPAPSSVIFTPESSVAPSPAPSALQNVLDFGRPLEIRGPAPGNFGSKKSYPTEVGR